MSSISNSLAGIIESLKTKNADPAQDPAQALKRLRLPGKARQPYTDIVRLSTSDMAVVARTLDDERQQLQGASSRADEASAALTKIEELLGEAKTLVEANARGAGKGRRKSNQKQVDKLLKEVDQVARDASEASPDLFAGRTTLKAGDASVQVDEISRQALGKLVLNGKALSLADVARQGALDSSRRRTAAEGAKKSINAAVDEVTDLRERIVKFHEESLRPRVGDVANALAGLFNDAQLGSSEQAIEVALDLREMTLASSTAALAVGAEGWDRERVLELLA